MRLSPPIKDDGPRAFWAMTWLWYGNELVMALRERNIIINSLLIPIFLYPVVFWLMLSLISYIEGSNAGKPSRVQLLGLPAAHEELRGVLATAKDLRLVTTAGDEQQARQLLLQGKLDVLVAFLPPKAHAVLPEDYRVRLVCNRAKDRSALAATRVQDLLDDYREHWLRQVTAKSGLTSEQWQVYRLAMDNAASPGDMGKMLLGILVPMIFALMVAIGCFYPAIDMTAGERERQTWESLMTTSAPRAALLTAKYLAVTSFGWLAGILNIVAILLLLKPMIGPLLAGSGASVDFVFPWSGLPVIVCGTALLSAFTAAGMMLFAAFARTFKEGQALLTPVLLCLILPAMFLQEPDLRFTMHLACLPVANLIMMVREAVTGVFHWPQIGLTILVSLALIAGCLLLATRVLRVDDVLAGSFNGNLLRYLGHLRRQGKQQMGRLS